jgi:hypothetical protein
MRRSPDEALGCGDWRDGGRLWGRREVGVALLATTVSQAVQIDCAGRGALEGMIGGCRTLHRSEGRAC